MHSHWQLGGFSSGVTKEIAIAEVRLHMMKLRKTKYGVIYKLVNHMFFIYWKHKEQQLLLYSLVTLNVYFP